MKSRILICNDDGIYSPGIASLAKVASRFGDVRIVAPDVEQSSMGHAITSSRPLRYRRTPLPGGFEAYRVNGTPADCVALGTYLWERVNLVLSGINLGPNLGSACWHSGTLAAAKQAALLGLRRMIIRSMRGNAPAVRGAVCATPPSTAAAGAPFSSRAGGGGGCGAASVFISCGDGGATPA